jgi:hypothetical protein
MEHIQVETRNNLGECPGGHAGPRCLASSAGNQRRMTVFKNVLLGVDGRPNGYDAIALASRLAEALASAIV